jgi:hypothetical protein
MKDKPSALKWLIIGSISGAAVAVIISVCSILIYSTPSGRYVKETYCADEYYTGEVDCNIVNYEEECIPVKECVGGIQTRYVPMGERLRSVLKTNLIIGIGLGVFAGFLVATHLLDKMRQEASG